MKLSFLAITGFLAGSSAGSADAGAQRRLSKEFMQAMHSQPKIIGSNKKVRAEKVRKLNEQLMKASRKLENQGYQFYNQQAQQSGWEGQYEQGQAYADMGEWNGQYWEFADAVPFDMTARAFKYSGCAAIKSYDVERAYENGNPMVMDTYAVFRLCPADKCNKYSLTGCGSNYGEYAIDMNTYLTYVLSFYEERYEQFCEYCAPCDWEYTAQAKTSLAQCYADLTQQEYQYANDKKKQAWQDYYNSNNGDMSGWNAYENVNGQDMAYGGDQSFQTYNNYYNAAKGYENTDYYQPYNNGGRKLEEDGDSDVDEYGNYVDGDADEANDASYQYANDEEVDQEAYDQYQEAVNNQEGYWGADGKFYMYDQQQQQEVYPEQQTYQCLDGSMCDYCQMMQEQEYATCDDYVCGDYYTYCSDLYGQQNDLDMMDFLECQGFETEGGEIYYVGPHCGSDHFTISLGVFSDENCVNSVGETVSLSYVLGFDFDDNDLFKLPKECISCDGTNEEEEEANQQEEYQGIYGEYAAAPETDVDGVVAVCRALYAGSAQCNSHMKNFNQISMYMSEYELKLEEKNCAFIDNIIWGSYDESGEILLTPEEFDFSDWRNVNQYRRIRMPASQAMLLSLSIVICVALASIAAYTRRTLIRSSDPWVPKRPNLNDKDLIRQSSGIRLARARSGPGDVPLI